MAEYLLKNPALRVIAKGVLLAGAIYGILTIGDFVKVYLREQPRIHYKRESAEPLKKSWIEEGEERGRDFEERGRKEQERRLRKWEKGLEKEVDDSSLFV